MNAAFLMFLVYTTSGGTEMRMQSLPDMASCQKAIKAMEVFDPKADFYRKGTEKCITVSNNSLVD